MSDLSRWTGPVALGPFRFGGPGSFAERVGRMSDDELRAEITTRALSLLDYWRGGGDDARALAILLRWTDYVADAMSPEERLALEVAS